MLKQLMMALTLTAGLTLLAPVSKADASWGSWFKSWWSQRSEKIEQYKARKSSSRTPSRTTSSRSVPELDPGAAGGAIVLLVGGVAYIVSRRREEEDLA